MGDTDTGEKGKGRKRGLSGKAKLKIPQRDISLTWGCCWGSCGISNQLFLILRNDKENIGFFVSLGVETKEIIALLTSQSSMHSFIRPSMP